MCSDQLIPFPAIALGLRHRPGLVRPVAARRARSLGIVDATPVRHLRPVGIAYDMDRAIEEGEALLRKFQVRRGRQDFLSGDRILSVKV